MKRQDRAPLTLLLLYFFFNAAYMSYFPFITVLLRQRGFSAIQIGLLTTCTAVLNFAAQFLTGRLSRHLPGRRMMLLYLALSAPTGFVLMITGQSLISAAAAAALINLLDFTLIGQLDAYTLALSARDTRIQYSHMRACTALTGAVFSFSMGRVLDLTGIQAMAGFHAGLMLCALAVLCCLPDVLPGAPQQSTGTQGRLFCGRYILLLGCIALVYMAWRAIIVYLPVLLTDLDGGIGLQGLSMGIASLSPLPVLLAYPWIRRHFSLRLLLPCAALVMALRVLIIALEPPVWALVLQQAGEGLSLGLLSPGIMELLPQLVPRHNTAQAVSIVTGVQMALCTVLCSGIMAVLMRWMPLSRCFGAFGILCIPGAGGLALLAAYKKETDG